VYNTHEIQMQDGKIKGEIILTVKTKLVQQELDIEVIIVDNGKKIPIKKRYIYKNDKKKIF